MELMSKYVFLLKTLIFQYEWEAHPQREHRRLLRMARFFIDRYPVTNANFSRFLQLSGYKPRSYHNYLKFWTNGTFPPEDGDKPVVWVSYNEAQSYCAFFGRRLPHEPEWQYAAQGTTSRLYPWGNVLVSCRCYESSMR